MPSNIPAELLTHYASQALALANCILVTRKDGMKYGMTGHDQDIVVAGQLYKAIDSASVTAIKSSSDTGVDNMEVVGILSDDTISEVDILAGRFDSAEVLIFQVCYEHPEWGYKTLMRGVLGEITLTEGQFSAEVRSNMTRLKQLVVESTSPTCRVRRFGDARCKVSVAANSYSGKHPLAVPVDPLRITVAGLANVDGDFDFGRLVCTGGQNAGLEVPIRRHDKSGSNAVLGLRSAFFYPVLITDTFTVIRGCDRRWTTCKNKFNNTLNFRGEPHLPGNTKSTEVARPPS